MALKYQVETLDGVDEAARSLYKEVEGGYRLDVEGAVAASDVSDLKQRNVDLAEEAKRRRKTNERWQELGESPEAVREAMQAKGKPDADHEAIVAQIKSDYEAKLSDAQKQVHGMRTGRARADFEAALGQAGLHPQLITDIAAGSFGRVTFDESGDLRIMAADGSRLMAGSGADGYATIADLAQEVAASKPAFLVDQGKGGGGKQPPASKPNGMLNGMSQRAQDILKDLPPR